MAHEEATEADKVTVLGLTFRSGDHLFWFVVSMLLMFALTVGRLRGSGPSFLTNLAVQFHVSASVIAVVVTRFGRVNGRIYSRDCIWFNALMAAVDACIIHTRW